jgi:hypothetical protein
MSTDDPTPAPTFAENKDGKLQINDFTELYLIFGQIVVFFSFLKYLLRVAKLKMMAEFPIHKDDEFMKDYGYSWDYVFVFAVYDEDDKEDMTKMQVCINVCLSRSLPLFLL